MALQHFYSGKIKWKFKKRNNLHPLLSQLVHQFYRKPFPSPNPPFSRETFQSTAIGAASRLPASAIGVGIFSSPRFSIQQLPNLPISPRLGHHTFQGNIALVVVDVSEFADEHVQTCAFFQRNDLQKTQKKKRKKCHHESIILKMERDVHPPLEAYICSHHFSLLLCFLDIFC